MILLEAGTSIQQVMKKLNVSRRTVFYWKQ
ncbi:helix-turn-helix domain-containing protein [Pseudomonas fragi]